MMSTAHSAFSRTIRPNYTGCTLSVIIGQKETRKGHRQNNHVLFANIFGDKHRDSLHNWGDPMKCSRHRRAWYSLQFVQIQGCIALDSAERTLSLCAEIHNDAFATCSQRCPLSSESITATKHMGVKLNNGSSHSFYTLIPPRDEWLCFLKGG